MKRYDARHIFQLREIAIGLTFIGGFIDAYTFVSRGGVLAAGQTGNIIFLSVDIAQRNLPGAMIKLVTMLFFIIGLIIVGYFRNVPNRSHYWRMPFLVCELIVCVIVGFLPKSLSNLYVTPPLALVMAMQTATFSKIEGNSYNNVFSTGNLKKSVNSLADYLFSSRHDRAELETALVYGELVLGFASGAIVSAVIQLWLNVKSIWIAILLLIVVGGYYASLLYRRDQQGEL